MSSNLMRDLKDRVYVVTGASRGIGQGCAKALARRDAKIGMIARNAEEVRQCAAELGENAYGVACDVMHKVAVTRAIDEISEHFGGIDGLINNAGGSRLAPVAETSDADARLMFDLNVMGMLYASQAAAPHMKKRGGGAIINISTSSVHHTGEFPHMGFYAGIKAAIERMSREMREELKFDGIGVTLFRPGGVLTTTAQNWSPESLGKAYAVYLTQGEYNDGTMHADLMGEAIVRCFEAPAGAAYDLVEFRPNVPTLRKS